MDYLVSSWYWFPFFVPPQNIRNLQFFQIFLFDKMYGISKVRPEISSFFKYIKLISQGKVHVSSSLLWINITTSLNYKAPQPPPPHLMKVWTSTYLRHQRATTHQWCHIGLLGIEKTVELWTRRIAKFSVWVVLPLCCRSGRPVWTPHSPSPRLPCSSVLAWFVHQ